MFLKEKFLILFLGFFPKKMNPNIIPSYLKQWKKCVNSQISTYSQQSANKVLCLPTSSGKESSNT